jgi:hypothetical protein
MFIKNAENRTSEIKGRNERSELESESGSLGGTSNISREYGTNQVGASRANRDESNIVVAGESTLNEISGKIAGQLISETEKQLVYHQEQLAYHAQQAEALNKRLQELKQISNIDK